MGTVLFSVFLHQDFSASLELEPGAEGNGERLFRGRNGGQQFRGGVGRAMMALIEAEGSEWPGDSNSQE